MQKRSGKANGKMENGKNGGRKMLENVGEL